MKKEGALVFVLVIFLFAVSVSAQTGSNAADEASITSKINKGYQCLEKQIEEKNSLTLQEAVFSLLALGKKNKLLDSISSEKRSNAECWPSAGCKVKDSAQVMLAYKTIGKDVSKIKDWINSTSQITKDLTWYLEIDIKGQERAKCLLEYNGRKYDIAIKEDMKVDGDPGGCFSIGYEGYWLKINENCLDDTFDISCEDKEFVSALVYQKKKGGAVYVSSDTKSGAVTRQVNAKCFESGDKCDYEGTLWAALSLNYLGEDIKSYLPYLIALADDNQKYFPNTFLYILGAGEDQYDEIIGKQKSGKYWDIVGSPYNKFYDSALAMIALGGTNAEELANSEEYFIGIQTNEGCWNNNNVRDSAFLLYAAWPRKIIIEVVKEACGEGMCVGINDCLDAGGNILEDFICLGYKKCCSLRPIIGSCIEQGGISCGVNEQCSGFEVPSLEGGCCIGSCKVIEKVINECEEDYDRACRKSCSAREDSVSADCPISGDECCIEKAAPAEPEKDYTWIIILSALIVLLILAIIFRRKIQMAIFKRRAGGKTAPGFENRGMPPRFNMGQRAGPSYGPGQRMQGVASPRITRGAKSQKDIEMDETMRKLREMSN